MGWIARHVADVSGHRGVVLFPDPSPAAAGASPPCRLLAAVKKNDRVLTTGGIYGVVTNVHREANEVTIKVDEATNTKLRMTLGSIAQVLGDEPAEDAASK